MKLFIKYLFQILDWKKYIYILKHINQVNVAENREFQKRFNGFYRVRRDEAWQEQFYGFFETAKVQNPSFDEIIEELYHRTGRIEASFSSKMLANIDDSKPIWDSFVLNALGFKNPLPSMPKLEQMKRKIEFYHKIDRWYVNHLKTENTQECIAKFNEILPECTWISDVKKIDCFLWNMR